MTSWQAGIREKSQFELSVRVRQDVGVYQRVDNKMVPLLDDEGTIIEWHGMSWTSAEAHAGDKHQLELHASHIRAARELLDVTGQQLAAIADVSFPTLSRMEIDAASVKADGAARVKQTLAREGVHFDLTDCREILLGVSQAR